MSEKIKSLRKISDKLRCVELYETKKIIQKLQKFDPCSTKNIKFLIQLFKKDNDVKSTSFHALFNNRVYKIIQQIVLLLGITINTLATINNTIMSMNNTVDNIMSNPNINSQIAANNVYQLYLKQLNNLAIACHQDKISIINGANALLIINFSTYEEQLNCYDLTSNGLFLTGTNTLSINNSYITHIVLKEANMIITNVTHEVNAMLDQFLKYKAMYKDKLYASQEKLCTLSQSKLSAYICDAQDILTC